MFSDSEIIREAVKWDAAAWFETATKIVKKTGELARPTANIHQQRLNEVFVVAHELGRPCRINGLKPRQKGSSTISVAIGHTRLKAKLGRGLIAGGKHFQGKNLFKMLKTYANNDEVSPKSCSVMDMEARYSNGSTMERITLATGDAGRSGTYQFLLITEAAYLADEGVANADNVMDGLVKCVPYEADTIIILESTANGAKGYFHDNWEAGITLEEFKAGKNGYVNVFSAWFEFADSWMEPSREGIESPDDYTEHEADYAEKWNLSLGQMAWMRWAIREECSRDFDKFQQDYPSDPESAFLRSGRCVFGAEGMAHQEKLVAIRPSEYGYLQYNDKADRVDFIPTREGQARCLRWEKPKNGCRYLISVDPMTGADQTGGDDPDSHSVLVHRAGYLQHGQWVEPALVMRNMLVPGKKPGSLCCWWNIDVLEEEVWRMARYWKALIVPEMNMDRGMVELLKLRNDVDIYQREIFNRRENTKTSALGWTTDKKTRPMIIETLAATVREAGRGTIDDGYEVRCPWIIKQMKNFGTKPNGRMEALVGHDDDVLSLAIGVQLLDMATPWYLSEREAWDPFDKDERARKRLLSQWS